MRNEPVVASARLATLCILLVLTACSGGGGASADGGIGGTGNSVGAIQAFGSVIVNGTEFDTTGAEILIDGRAATQDDLRIGQVVTVSADFADNKASSVEYRSRTRGPVQALTIQDAALGTATLTVLGQQVATNSATSFVGLHLDPAATDALQIGDLVEVSGQTDANGTIVATFVEARPTLGEYGAVGVITNVTATTFQIGTLTVDYSATGATPSSGANLAIEGAAANFDPSTNRLTADSIESLPTVAQPVGTRLEVEGYITQFGSSADFRVEDVRTRATSGTTFENGTAANLGLNAKIEVKGTVDGAGVLVANEITFESTGAVRIEGSVEQIDPQQQSLIVLGVPMVIGQATDLEDDSSAQLDPLTFADIAVGDRIEMRGFLESSSVVASELDRADPRPDARLRGRVTAKNAGASQIDILGTTVTGDAATNYQGAAGQTAFFDTVQVGDFVDARWNDFTSTDAAADELDLVQD